MSKKKPKISEMRNKAGRVVGLARHSDQDYACPYCNCPHDVTTAAERQDDGLEPPEGSYSICVSCTEVSIFVTATQLRPLTESEKSTLPPETWRHVRALRQVEARGPN
jgi:hypothetical protein